MGSLFAKKDDIPRPDIEAISNGNGKHKIHFYTGNSSKLLYVHVMQDGIEVDKPIKTVIYAQSVEWNKRQYPIVPERFIYDNKGIAHQYVSTNDVSVLTWHKDHEDYCKKCGGKMYVDARESRALGRRGIFHAIWGLDNTHVMLLVVLMLGAMAMAGAFFWAYNQDTLHKTQLESAKADIAKKNNVIEQYYNMTGIRIGG